MSHQTEGAFLFLSVARAPGGRQPAQQASRCGKRQPGKSSASPEARPSHCQRNQTKACQPHCHKPEG